MKDVIERLQGRDGRPAGEARAHAAGHFFKPEAAALQHHQRLNFGVLEWKATAEDAERLAVDTDKTGSRVVDWLTQDRPQHDAKEADSESAYETAVLAIAVK